MRKFLERVLKQRTAEMLALANKENIRPDACRDCGDTYRLRRGARKGLCEKCLTKHRSRRMRAA